jgi:hypothetical protein
MKKKLLFVVVILAIAVAAYFIVSKSKNIKLIEETPCENITGAKAEVKCEGNSVWVMPEKGTHDSSVRLEGNWNFAEYKAISFTLENLDAKPLRITLRMASSDKKFGSSRRSFPGEVGDLY